MPRRPGSTPTSSLPESGSTRKSGANSSTRASTTRSSRFRERTRRPTTGSAIMTARGRRSAPFAAMVTKAGLPLTLNAVISRPNLHQVGAFIGLALELGAKRLRDRPYAVLRLGSREPRRADAAAQGDRGRDRAGRGGAARLKGKLVIDMVVPDYYARYPKPCAGGWGRIAINVSPSGKVSPCHAAETITGLEFWNVRHHSLGDIWRDSPAFRAFRGTDWMQEPCRSCDRRETDWGGCRCQALALVGDAAATDPACHKSPHHARIAALAVRRSRRRARRDPLAVVQGESRGVRKTPSGPADAKGGHATHGVRSSRARRAGSGFRGRPVPGGRAQIAQLKSDDAFQATAQLFAAARLGCEREARALLDRGAAVDAKDREGMTALAKSAKSGKVEVMRCSSRRAQMSTRDRSTARRRSTMRPRPIAERPSACSSTTAPTPTFAAEAARRRSPPPPTTARSKPSRDSSSTAPTRMRSTTTARARWSTRRGAPTPRSSAR